MRILVIGASGASGCRVVSEAEERGHTVTRASRTPRGGPHPTDSDDQGARSWVRLDAADAAAVAHAARGHDAILGATRPGPGREDEVRPATCGLAAGARQAGMRLLIVGGAGPLRVPGTDTLAIDDQHWVPPAYRTAAAASVEQLRVLQATSGVDWTYLAPPARFEPGERTGAYRAGGAELVVAADGTSAISMEDFAIAAVDELESPTTRRGVLSIGT